MPQLASGDGANPFICIYVANGAYRFEHITVRDFYAARDWLLSAELLPGERPFGVWHRHLFYPWLGAGMGPTGSGLGVADEKVTERVGKWIRDHD